ncbi:DNA polymerase domain-containing protein [Halostagnicola kamekurae]|uniref:DNA-directed DNA polymerase n=1 Tax=Halostagnicola kamekurae TaxID=619731 RepID=A0A1I6RUD8_9EURY|nr:DNA polymerase domain-containing protein [Halostagnicola kamekurae]SFS68343.1 DNA polymerase I [Halostagnicola kamekurae]
MTGPYTFEFEDGLVREWRLTEDGATFREVERYRPSLFVSAPDLSSLEQRLRSDPKVSGTTRERWAADLHESHVDERTELLRVSVERVDEIRTLAREIRGGDERERYAPGAIRLYDVDLDPGFRYCLDNGIDPTPERGSPAIRGPDRGLRTLEIEIDEPGLADEDVSELRLDGERVTGDPADVCWSIGRRLDRVDPDVLVLSHGDLVPVLESAAARAGLEEFHLGRLPGWRRIAGANTYESYGAVGHSPARYRVPGRAIVDRSNSFLWHQSGLPGLLYMVEKTGRPLQEVAGGSIGTLLTSRQIRLARNEHDVLAPQNKWEPEEFKDVSTLHAGDRGGFTFSPEVGFHEDVHEIDFASLYPRIICRRNVSPETIGCDRDHGSGGSDASPLDSARDDAATVPELEYDRCSKPGFLPEVLMPLLDDRAEIKRQLESDSLADEAARRLRAESGAIKWVLVSCFGYQGYRNAKFGRIECHESINAYARDIALRAKTRLEDGGWHVVHGIVDSLWVTAREDDPEPLEAVIEDVSSSVGIDLEHDGRYEWVCFVPLRDSGEGASAGGDSVSPVSSSSPPNSRSRSTRPGALNKYFGKRTDGNYKFRGIETRQRSTPEYVAESQREFVTVLDRERDPAAVCDALEARIGRLRRGAVDPDRLVHTKRVSRRLEEYSQRTRTVAALERYDRHGVDRHPGQSVEYVVTDDDADGIERVRLAFEDCPSVDVDYYSRLLVSACESVVSPLGWDRRRIREHLRDGRTVRLSTFASSK